MKLPTGVWFDRVLYVAVAVVVLEIVACVVLGLGAVCAVAWRAIVR